MGGSKTLRSTARIVAATNEDLEALVRSGRFRADLYYRLAQVKLVVPPLRERHADLLELAYQLLEEICAQKNRPVPTIEPSAVAEMRNYPWPGNVRELRAVLLDTMLDLHGDRISSLALPSAPTLPQPMQPVQSAQQAAEFFQRRPTPELRRIFFQRKLKDRLDEYRDHWLRQALIVAEHDVNAAARMCDISVTGYYAHLKRLGVTTAAEEHAGSAQGASLLFVDDHTIWRNRPSKTMASLGFELTVATSGEEAIDLIEQGNSFDYILCDLIMPGMSGMEVYEYLKANHPDLAAEGTFFLMTGQAWALAGYGVTLDESRIIEKPFDCNTLCARLTKRPRSN